MTTREAMRVIAERLKQELVICTTGFTCRDMQSLSDRPENFYMIGSMGLAAPLGLGIAMLHPQKKVVIFDGDGAVLMGLGILPMTGAIGPRNFIHVVFDNEAFVSTGNQPTYSKQVDLDRLAASCGYACSARASSSEELVSQWQKASQSAGPSFLLIKCQPDAGKPMERVRMSPQEIKSRFMEVVRI